MRVGNWIVKIVGVLGVIATTVAMVSAQQNIDPRVLAYADIIVFNGKVVTADDAFTIVEAFAVRDGKILARGTTADMMRLAGPKTRRIDLQGKSVVPGFIESHSHGWEAQALKQDIDGTVVFKTLEDGLEQVRKIAATKPKGKLIQLFSPRNTIANNVSRYDLDKVSPDNPVMISFSTYEYNTNTLALNMFRDFVKDPNYAGLIKDPKTGEPTGQLRGLASGVMGYDVLPWPDLNPLRPIEIKRMARYNRQGTTMLIGRAPAASITLLRDIWAEGELNLRLRITHEFLRDNPQPELFLKRLGNLTGLGDDWFKIIGTLVQQPDGGSAAGAILTSLPKLRLAPKGEYGPFGQNRWAEHGNARESAILAGRYGWKLASIHSYGDESTRNLLEGFKAASKEKRMLNDKKVLPSGNWVIDHNYIGTQETVALMKELNVIPSVLQWWRLSERADGEMADTMDALEGQGGFTPELGNAMVYMYGSDRLNDNWSMAKTFIDAGLRPAAETAGNPLANIQAFVTRKDKDGRVWAPQERVDRRQALWMKTRWPAYISQDEKNTGSLEEGKWADFTILGGDYMTVPDDQISKLPIVMTVVGGRTVYEAGAESAQ